MIKTYFATSNTGTPLLGKSFILKDRGGVLPDVPMTELGAGHYTADLTDGTAWNIYDGATFTGVVIDALLSLSREPLVSTGNSNHVYFGNKTFRAITISDVTGLQTSLVTHSNQIVAANQAIALLQEQIAAMQAPSSRTFEFGGKTYSLDPITVLALPGYREDGTGGVYVKTNWIVTEPSEVNPYFNVSIPGDGSWVDAFRLKQVVFDTGVIKRFNNAFIPMGLMHNIQSTFVIPYSDADGSISEAIDMRFSLLGDNSFDENVYSQIGNSIIGKFQGSFRENAGGSERVVVHSIRGIGAQIPVPGVQAKMKIELRLKTPGAPLVLSCNGGVFAQLHGQLYPEVS